MRKIFILFVFLALAASALAFDNPNTAAANWMKNPNNPALNKSAPGGWDDARIQEPSVFYNASNASEWIMSFYGWDGTAGYPTGVGIARSQDYGVTWNRAQTGSVLNVTVNSTIWDDNEISSPSIIANQSNPSQLLMYYSGFHNPLGVIMLAYGNSTYNVWDRYRVRPMLECNATGGTGCNEIYHPEVVYNGSMYLMFYGHNNASSWTGVYLAWSSNGMNWTKKSIDDTMPVVNRTPGYWFSGLMQPNDADILNGQIFVTYIARNSTAGMTHNYSIGMANCTMDGLTCYNLNQNDAMIEPNDSVSGGWEGSAIAGAGLFHDTTYSKYYMFYDGWQSNTDVDIGWANQSDGTYPKLYLNGIVNSNRSYTYPESVNATGMSNMAENVSIYRDDVYRTSGTSSAQENILLGAGTYLYKVNSTSNPTGVSYYAIVGNGTPVIYMWINGTQGNRNFYINSMVNFTAVNSVSDLTTNISSNISGWLEPTNTTSFVYNFTNITATGYYNITAYTNGSSNYSQAFVTYYVNVSSTADAYPTYSAIATSYPASYASTKTWMNITWSDDISIDDVLIESDYTGANVNYTPYNQSNVYFWNITLPAGTWHWKSYANDSTNQWTASTTQTFTISKASSPLALVTNTTVWTVMYPTASNVSGSGCVSGETCNLYRNNIAIGTPDDNQMFAAGIYAYIWNTTGNANYSPASVTNNLIVLGSNPVGLTMTFNQTQNTAGNKIWNETFTSSSNKTFYMNLPKNSTVTNAKLNVSGYYTDSILEQTSVTTSNGYCLIKSGSYCSQSFNTTNNSLTEIDLGLYILNTPAKITLGIGTSPTGNEILTTTKDVASTGYRWEAINFSRIAITPNTTYYIYVTTNNTLDNQWWWKGGNPYPNGNACVGTDCSTYSDYDLQFKSYTSYVLTNPYLTIANFNKWNYTGTYSGNEQTTDFSSELNSYLKTCIPYTDGTCDVPFVIHSDSAGIMQINLNTTITYDTQLYDTPVNAGDDTTFWVQVNSSADITDVNATLVWNGTNYAHSSKSNATNIWTFTRILTVPSVSSDSNISFYWSFIYANTTGSYVQNFSSDTQIVYAFSLANCTTGNITLNFTAYNELNSTQNLTYDMDAQFTYWRGTSIPNNISYEYRNGNEYYLCINPYDATLKINAVLKYWAAGYTTRYYYFDDYDLTNAKQNISLFLIDNITSTQTTLAIYNAYNQPVGNEKIDIQRNFLGNWKTISQGKTLDDGMFTFNLDPNNIYTIYLTGSQGSKSTTLQPKLSAYTIYLSGSLIELPTYWNAFNNFNDVCAYDNITAILTCTYTDTSGHLRNINLNVYSIGSTGSSRICLNTSTSSSGTFKCQLPSINNVTYSWSLMATYSSSPTLLMMDSGTVTIYTFFKWGLIGVFLTFLIVSSTGFISLQFGRPSYLVFSTLLSIVFCFFIGFIGPSESIVGAVLGLIFSGMIIMYRSNG